jgi:hypothetical protein
VDRKIAPVEFKQVEMAIPQYHPEDLRSHDGKFVVYEKVERI